MAVFGIMAALYKSRTPLLRGTFLLPAALLEAGPDCFGTITSLGNNLIGDISDCDINLQPSDLTGDPGLGPLVGGGEEDAPGGAHFPVLAGSAVIGKGNPSACLPNDQVGHLRDGTCDIGAVEFGGLVAIDIRPKKDANKINPNNNKDINVAILSGNGFDATTVDETTVLFGRTGIEASPADGYFEGCKQRWVYRSCCCRLMRARWEYNAETPRSY